VPLGVDFQGGTQVQVQFQNASRRQRDSQARTRAGIKDAQIVQFDAPESARC
jgi:preprotein translocase subunit SecF